MPYLDEIEAAIPGLRAFAQALARDRELANDSERKRNPVPIKENSPSPRNRLERGPLSRCPPNDFSP